MLATSVRTFHWTCPHEFIHRAETAALELQHKVSEHLASSLRAHSSATVTPARVTAYSDGCQPHAVESHPYCDNSYNGVSCDSRRQSHQYCDNSYSGILGDSRRHGSGAAAYSDNRRSFSDSSGQDAGAAAYGDNLQCYSDSRRQEGHTQGPPALVLLPEDDVASIYSSHSASLAGPPPPEASLDVHTMSQCHTQSQSRNQSQCHEESQYCTHAQFCTQSQSHIKSKCHTQTQGHLERAHRMEREESLGRSSGADANILSMSSTVVLPSVNAREGNPPWLLQWMEREESLGRSWHTAAGNVKALSLMKFVALLLEVVAKMRTIADETQTLATQGKFELALSCKGL